MDELQAGVKFTLTVFPQPPIFLQPGKAALNDPALGHDLEGVQLAAFGERFRKDPAYAQELLNEVLADGAMDEAMIVLRQMSKAFGGVDAVAREAHLNGKTLYRTLSPKGNPHPIALTESGVTFQEHQKKLR